MPEGQRPRGVTLHPRSGAVAKSTRLQWFRKGKRSYPTSEVKGGSWEERPHVQGAVAVWAQEGLEELFHVQGQEGRQ